MSHLFDIFLACGTKDYNKLPFVINSIEQNIHGYNNIFVCTPTRVNVGENIIYYLDQDILPTDRSLWSFRPNWCFQQHLKLFQNVTLPYYLTLDCDTIINRPIKFFHNDTPIWYKGWDQLNQPYFTFNQRILGLDRIPTRTFIADMNFMYRPFIQEMLKWKNYTIESFIEASQKLTTPTCYMAEPELYGQYCLRFHPDFYQIEILKQDGSGRLQETTSQIIWSNKDVETIIYNNKSKDLDTFAMHSWCWEGCKPA